MKKAIRQFLLICLTIGTLSTFCSCAASNYEAHGLEDHKYSGGYNSSVEIDVFSGIKPLINDYPYIDADYYYSYKEDYAFYNTLERAIYYFEYTETDYQAAKAYCRENFAYLGDEITEEYNGYEFYDFYAKRSKEEFYHGDDYPEAFKRVAFNDEKKAIVFLGIYTSDKRTEEVTGDVQNWGDFLHKYFFEFYSFGE